MKSIILLDDYPLYSMHFKGNYDPEKASTSESGSHEQGFQLLTNKDVQHHPTWACSLFAALGDPENMLFGAIHWQYSPALLFFTIHLMDILQFHGRYHIPGVFRRGKHLKSFAKREGC